MIPTFNQNKQRGPLQHTYLKPRWLSDRFGVHTIPDNSVRRHENHTGLDRASVHKKKRWFRRDFCDSARVSPFGKITACHVRSHELILTKIFVKPRQSSSTGHIDKNNDCQQISSLSVVSSSSLAYTGTIRGKRAASFYFLLQTGRSPCLNASIAPKNL